MLRRKGCWISDEYFAVFCVRYSPDGQVGYASYRIESVDHQFQFIAASRGNGEIDIYSTVNGNKVKIEKQLLSMFSNDSWKVYLLPGQQGFDGAPTCCVRFRPNTVISKIFP